MNDIQRALSQIADIRAQVAASNRFRGIAPGANVFMGLLSLAVANAQAIWPETLARDPLRYVAVWAGVAILFTLIAATEAISRARRLHAGMADAMLGSALLQLLPFAAAGLLITVVLCSFAPGSAWMLPGLWQILIGLLGFSALPSLPPAMAWAAGWFFLCGSAVLALAGWTGTLSPWMMGVPLAVGQISVAFILYRASGEHDDRA